MIGHPVEKARTPTLFNSWASSTGRDIVMVGLSVPPSGLANVLGSIRSLENCLGAVVTYPHKQAAYSLLDKSDSAAKFNQACNVIRREADGRLSGAMTDGIGCIDAMERNGTRLAGADFLLIGAGGAGSAIAHEAAQRGATGFVIIDLDAKRQAELLTRLMRTFPHISATTTAAQDFRYDIACNATPLGMNGEGVLPYPLERLGPHTLVADVVPTPAITHWLQAALDRGMRIQTGAEMVSAQIEYVIGHLLGIAPDSITVNDTPALRTD